MKQSKKNILPFLTLISVFFFWGFVAAGNDILIPAFKEKLNLEQWQSQMISFAFYVAYTIGSIVYYLVSRTLKNDLLDTIGYKNGIATGLLISAAGTLMFYPAAEAASFGLMICGLFIVGLGFSLQQIAVNPLAIVLNDDGKGSQRLSLGGGLQNFGGTVGPLILNVVIFGSMSTNASTLDIESVKTPYLFLGVAFVVVAAIFKFSSLPDKVSITGGKSTEAEKDRPSVLNYPQLWMGMIAIFLYVGVEVSTASNLPEFMKENLQTPTDKIAPFVSLFWASLMIGRWTSSVEAFNLSESTTKVLRVLMPYAAFAIFLLVTRVANHDITPFLIYALIIAAMIAGEMLSNGDPIRLLLIYSLMGIAALSIAIFSDGMTSVYAIISVGLFCSTLWPCIFTAAIAGLGKHTNQGSNLLIMMIMGGGFISLLQGYLAGSGWLGIQWSYLVGVGCFAYLVFYSLRVRRILMLQGVRLSSRLPKTQH